MGAAASFLAIGASVLSAGLGAFGQIRQGQAQAAQAGYLAQVARNDQALAQRNAELRENDARDAERRGTIDEDRRRLAAAHLAGAQRAALASQGGDVNDGSPVDLIGDRARAGALDALEIRADAQRRAYGYRLAARNAQDQAAMHGVQAGLHSLHGARGLDMLPFGVGSSLLGNVGGIVDQGRRYGFW